MTEEQLQLLDAAANQDPLYQVLLAQCTQLEQAYETIRSQLSPKQQEVLAKYISLCEEMEFRRTCLALDLPKGVLCEVEAIAAE